MLALAIRLVVLEKMIAIQIFASINSGGNGSVVRRLEVTAVKGTKTCGQTRISKHTPCADQNDCTFSFRTSLFPIGMHAEDWFVSVKHTKLAI